MTNHICHPTLDGTPKNYLKLPKVSSGYRAAVAYLHGDGEVQCAGGAPEELVHQVRLVLLVTANHEAPLHVLQVHAKGHARLILAAGGCDEVL